MSLETKLRYSEQLLVDRESPVKTIAILAAERGMAAGVRAVLDTMVDPGRGKINELAEPTFTMLDRLEVVRWLIKFNINSCNRKT